MPKPDSPIQTRELFTGACSPDIGEYLLHALHGLPHRVWLDSQHPSGPHSRFDIISAAPTKTFQLSDQECRIDSFVDGQRIDTESSKQPLWSLLRQQLDQLGTPAQHPDIPFQGGALGIFGYESNNRFHNLPDCQSERESSSFPQAMIGIYLWAIVIDHKLKKVTWVIHPKCPAELESEIGGRLDSLDSSMQQPQGEHEKFRLTRPFRSIQSKPEYLHSVDRIQDYIRAGDCYQVNLALKFSAEFEGSGLSAYLELRKGTRTPFGGWMEVSENHHFLSFSPERFLRCYEGKVETRPIKGTRPRGRDELQDTQLKTELQYSEKERAENLMIVDLMRNDISQCCKPGSVKVKEIFRIESYPAVHHLVSSIVGELEESKNNIDLLHSCLPGGSITGAPKRRAMQIIDELEPESRQAYCGNLVYLSCCGRMDSNIAIRSLVTDKNAIHCWGGGAIVADSDPEREYQEIQDKIGAIMADLEK